MNTPRTGRLIIDGYSLLHRDPELKPLLNKNLALARQLLLRKVERVADDLAQQTTVVFDGKGPPQQPDVNTSHVEVLFAPPHLTADSVIERLVCADTNPERITVVTSDRAERQTVAAAGADSMSCGDFLDRCRSRHDAYDQRRPHIGDKGSNLGDYFPK